MERGKVKVALAFDMVWYTQVFDGLDEIWVYMITFMSKTSLVGLEPRYDGCIARNFVSAGRCRISRLPILRSCCFNTIYGLTLKH